MNDFILSSILSNILEDNIPNISIHDINFVHQGKMRIYINLPTNGYIIYKCKILELLKDYCNIDIYTEISTGSGLGNKPYSRKLFDIEIDYGNYNLDKLEKIAIFS